MSFWDFFKFRSKTQKILLRGISDLQQKKYREAIGSFDQVIARKPDHVWSYSFRGDCHQLLGDSKSAFDDYGRALKLNPKHVRTLCNRGGLYLSSKQHGSIDLALADISEAFRLGPVTANLLVTRANCYHGIGRTKEAIDDLLKAIEIDGRHTVAQNNLAWYLATSPRDDLRNGAKALEHALKAVGEEENPPPAYVGTLAAAYAEAGNFGEAIRWATKFLESNPPEESIERANQRLELYRQNKPYREEAGQFETVRDNRTPKS